MFSLQLLVRKPEVILRRFLGSVVSILCPAFSSAIRAKAHIAAVAFKQWLGASGWADEDVFLDLDDIGAGERWKDALNKAHARCEAIILVLPPQMLFLLPNVSQRYARREATPVRRSSSFSCATCRNSMIVGSISVQGPADVDSAAPPQSHIETINYRGLEHEVRFNGNELTHIKDYLTRRGIAPEGFRLAAKRQAECRAISWPERI